MKNIFTTSILALGLMLCAFASFAQTKITGKVTDASTNEVMAGVNIMIRGKVTGTTTNLDGTFTLYTQVLYLSNLLFLLWVTKPKKLS
jgi:hypothetical protein